MVVPEDLHIRAGAGEPAALAVVLAGAAAEAVLADSAVEAVLLAAAAQAEAGNY